MGTLMEENSIYKAEGGFLFYPLMDLTSFVVGIWTPQPLKQDSSYQLFISHDTTRLRRWLVFFNALYEPLFEWWGIEPHSKPSFSHSQGHLNIHRIIDKVKHLIELFAFIFSLNSIFFLYIPPLNIHTKHHTSQAFNWIILIYSHSIV